MNDHTIERNLCKGISVVLEIIEQLQFFMLQLGRPQVEYICPYGHGTLRADEVQISGLVNPEWTPESGDMWEDLYASSREDGRK